MLRPRPSMASASDTTTIRERSRYGRLLVGIGAALVVTAGAISLSRGESPTGTVAQGVVVLGHDLGGKSEADARAEIATIADELGRREIVLTAGDKEMRAQAAEVGVSLDVD